MYKVKEKPMVKQRLGKTPLATYGAPIPTVLTTQEAAADDQTGAAVRASSGAPSTSTLKQRIRGIIISNCSST
jgi:hypothetical protein